MTQIELCDNYLADKNFRDARFTSHFQKNSEGFWIKNNRIVVPNTDVKQQIMLDMHASPMSGHVGTRKTQMAIARLFFWPNMKQEIEDFVGKCHHCQTNKSSSKNSQKPAGLHQPLPIPSRRWEVVSMDFITCLSLTDAGYDAILVFVDKLSKMVHFVPTQTTITAEDFACLYVQNIIKLHGLSKILISDRDPKFTSNFMTALCRLLDIKQALSTAFHPQTDGQTERTNRNLQDMLRHYVAFDQKDWDKKLPVAEFAVNNAWHDTIQNTPFFLNYGQHPLTPVTMLTENIVPSAVAFGRGLEQQLQFAKTCLHQARDMQKAYVDSHCRDISYVEGQEVLLSTKNIRLKKTVDMKRKLMPKWIGPFKISKCVGPVAVRLDLPLGMKIHNVFHVSLVKPYRNDGSFKPLDDWRHYLEGQEMTLVTDHNPLTYLQTQPTLSRKQARWMEKLSRFNYK